MYVTPVHIFVDIIDRVVRFNLIKVIMKDNKN